MLQCRFPKRAACSAKHFRKLAFISGTIVLEVEKTRPDNGHFTGLSYKIGHKYDRKVPLHVLRDIAGPVPLFSLLLTSRISLLQLLPPLLNPLYSLPFANNFVNVCEGKVHSVTGVCKKHMIRLIATIIVPFNLTFFETLF